MGATKEAIMQESNGMRSIERVYSDPSAAQERAMVWRRLGLKNIRIEPDENVHGARFFVLTGTATDQQARSL